MIGCSFVEVITCLNDALLDLIAWVSFDLVFIDLIFSRILGLLN